MSASILYRSISLILVVILCAACVPLQTTAAPDPTQMVLPTSVPPTEISIPTNDPSATNTPENAPVEAVTTPTLPRTPVVIDTDMAPDDWMAILYLLQTPSVEVKAISVSGTGEAHCSYGIRNALRLTRLAGQENIPVACGRETPLKGNHAFPDSWRTSVDDFFGLTLPEGTNPADGQTSVELLQSVIGSSGTPMTMLTLGPLTTPAELLQTDPEIAARIEKIYIMGGAVNVPGNISPNSGVDNAVAEWNIYVDPYAANVVLASGVPVVLVPLDATNYVPLTREVYQRLESNHAAPAAGFVYTLYSNNQWMFDSGTNYFWDQFTAAVLTDESMATIENFNICVNEAEGDQSGGMVQREDCPSVQAATWGDEARFIERFFGTLDGTWEG